VCALSALCAVRVPTIADWRGEVCALSAISAISPLSGFQGDESGKVTGSEATGEPLPFPTHIHWTRAVGVL
jgi:hypothetical protein